MAALNHVALNLHIFISKLRRRRIIGIDSAHLGCRKNHHIRFFFFKKSGDLCLVCEIQLPMGPSDDIFIPFCL